MTIYPQLVNISSEIILILQNMLIYSLFIDCRELHLRTFCRQIHQCAKIRQPPRLSRIGGKGGRQCYLDCLTVLLGSKSWWLQVYPGGSWRSWWFLFWFLVVLVVSYWTFLLVAPLFLLNFSCKIYCYWLPLEIWAILLPWDCCNCGTPSGNASF